MGSHFYSLSRLNDDNKQIGVLTASIAIPVVYDLVYIISATDDRVVQTQIGFVAVALAVIIKVKPLYEMNELAIHLLVILHTWTIAKQ
jgi:hypothetical protein